MNNSRPPDFCLEACCYCRRGLVDQRRFSRRAAQILQRAQPIMTHGLFGCFKVAADQRINDLAVRIRGEQIILLIEDIFNPLDMAAQYIGKFTQKMISGQSGQQAVKPAVQSDRIADIAMLCRNGKRLIDIAQLLNGFIGNMRIRE